MGYAKDIDSSYIGIRRPHDTCVSLLCELRQFFFLVKDFFVIYEYIVYIF